MSYNIARLVAPSFALCSFSSSGAGNVAFSFLEGDFTPTINTTTITLDAGFEYFLSSAPCVNAGDTAGSYRHIIDGVDGTLYPIQATSSTGGLDQQFFSTLADADVSFQLYADSLIIPNSRLEIWRFPL